VYDMYPWDKRQPTDSVRTDPALKAVQVALDRRDNGGDAAGTPPAAPTRQ
jgi:hypothetical protein